MIRAVIFDMDGVIIDSEHIWDEVREQLTRDWGGRWHPGAQADMMGMSAPEWSRYMHEELRVDRSPDAINDQVVERMRAYYDDELPLIDGAIPAISRLAQAFELAVASSSNKVLIEAALDRAGVAHRFAATVSSEEVTRGKPAPDVYLEASRQLGIPPSGCAAIEDSSNGLRAASAAGMRVIAYPNRRYPPAADSLALADVTIERLADLSAAIVSGRA